MSSDKRVALKLRKSQPPERGPEFTDVVFRSGNVKIGGACAGI
jgi:hypothetical protein